MNNPINLCMTRVVQNIPPQILEVALRWYNRRFNRNMTLPSFITDVIIHNIILPETNLSGGRIKTIPLKNSYLEVAKTEHGGYAGDDGQYTLFRIPAEARDNLPIANVLSLQYPFNTYLGGGINNCDIGIGGYALVDQMDEILNSYTLARPRNHPVAYLMSGDLIKIEPSQYAMQNWLLTVRLSYDKQFTNLHDHALPVLANLTLYATRQWIFNNLQIDIDKAVMETGVEIGTIKSIIDSYSDSAEKYTEEMKQWRGVALLDPEVRRRLMLYQI